MPPEAAPDAQEQAAVGAPDPACPYDAEICEIRQAVFPVSSFDPIASATRISADLLVTNRHVVGDFETAEIYTPDGPVMARVVPSAYRGDLVLLQADGLPDEGLLPRLSPAMSVPPFQAIGSSIRVICFHIRYNLLAKNSSNNLNSSGGSESSPKPRPILFDNSNLCGCMMDGTHEMSNVCSVSWHALDFCSNKDTFSSS